MGDQQGETVLSDLLRHAHARRVLRDRLSTPQERRKARSTLGLPVEQCEVVVVQGRYLSAICGHPLPCPDPAHIGRDVTPHA